MNTRTSLGLKLATVMSLFFLLMVSSQVRAITLDEATAYASNFGGGFGELIDIWKVPPNDHPESVTAHLMGTTWELSQDQYISELARNEDVYYQDGLFNATLYPELFTSGTSEAQVGLWKYWGDATVDILAVMSAGYVAIYGYDPSAQKGGWTTADIANFINPDNPKLQGMSHITAYKIGVVPLPAAAPLFASALAVFGFISYRRRKNNST